jgi:hypothetical protein
MFYYRQWKTQFSLLPLWTGSDLFQTPHIQISSKYSHIRRRTKRDVVMGYMDHYERDAYGIVAFWLMNRNKQSVNFKFFLPLAWVRLYL